MRLQLLILLSCFSSLLEASDKVSYHETQLRIQPIGQVTVHDQSPSTSKHSPSREAPDVLGQQIYERHCIVCHKEGLAGAPRFQNESDWAPRLAGRTLDDLVATSLKGLNAMPAKGTCIQCNEEDLKAALSYMLPTS